MRENRVYPLNTHHRRSIRLPGYDYSQPGVYFITLVIRKRNNLFWEIENDEVKLSVVGNIADQNWREIPEHFRSVEIGPYIIMPNHIHGIIILQFDHNIEASQWDAPTRPGPKPGSIGAIIGAYKMSVTRRIQSKLNQTAIWQRNYYEHIIRNEKELDQIRRYIQNNPVQWGLDEENPGNKMEKGEVHHPSGWIIMWQGGTIAKHPWSAA